MTRRLFEHPAVGQHTGTSRRIGPSKLLSERSELILVSRAAWGNG